MVALYSLLCYLDDILFSSLYKYATRITRIEKRIFLILLT